MSKKILVIAQLPPPVHGSNVMTQRFMEALSVNGFDTKIVQKTFSQTLEDVGQVTLSKISQIPGLCRNVMRTIRQWPPDLCVYFISVGWTSLLVDCLIIGILRYYNVPYLLYFHGKGYRKYDNVWYLPVRSLIRNTLTNSIGGLVLGESLKYDVNHYIPNESLHVLPNGIPDIEHAKRVHHQRNGSPIQIMFLSNLIPKKGPMEFLKMAKSVLMQCDDKVRFTLTGIPGSDQYLEELNSFIVNQGLESHVQITGPLYHEEKENLFCDSDIFVFPTQKDTLPVVNLEAMQWGLPVISSPIGAIPEIIRDGINGFIVDPFDIALLTKRVIELIRNPDLRERMGNAGRKLYEENYSLSTYNSNVKKAMESFLDH